MRRFFVLLKKELKEMLTWQTLIPILMVMVIYGFLGRVINQEQKKQAVPQPITVVDLDRSQTSDMLAGILAKADFKVTTITEGAVDDIVRKVASENGVAVVVIPRGFEAGINERKPQTVQTYTILRSFSILGMKGTFNLDAALSAMNEYVGDTYIKAGAPGLDPAIVRHAINAQTFVTVGAVSAEGDPQSIVNVVMQQTMVIPIVLTLVIILAAQMIAASIAGEKENKTLETLLSTPIARGALVTAKMMAAGIVALISAAAYMVGMKSYMGSLLGSSGGTSGTASQAIQKLGLVLDLRGYVLLGLSVFMGIMVALSIAVILGAFAEDLKSVQILIMPLIMIVLLPYLMTMFIDINTTSPILKWLIYAIPFSHPFMAAQFIFAHNFTMVVAGIIYQFALFLVLATVAARIFSTDRILTMKLNTARRGLRAGGWTLEREGISWRIRRK
ncbi:ABC transporter permease [Candidatus Cryosericum odellii]|jgi:ABC-2 type transport system permease protein|uniref:ABC transporter permease n=1 Tax=Candidatus Cryosericum odellii TaxID=2290917 RepID=A0A398D3X2_9BACT|nr:ABC transporter permease [Candidatus Cryosericum odellii]RIE09872.1 ABC transporter permease [Candidatus Cryosericum odellii]RIE14433.1 ABC transporter permease [Candidatus Cryosericum odellii]